ncbi:acyltransferase [Alloalcanivorax balearicus]|uniref:acyltransferase n=1 Tax=Alloalcanivorax balearicus TaxID=413232 RepID=UPI0021CD6141|nr:DapH/DapD/GlmU-related protein [Alloalcanivorax balearicus]
MLYYIFKLMDRVKRKAYSKYYKRILNIHRSVSLGEVVLDKKNITIDKGSYIRSGEVASGEASVVIGRYCAIGSNVSIRARSHDFRVPTASDFNEENLRVHGDIIIGDYVWIGNNVFIRHGVKIGDHAIIGANSVVVSDVPDRAIYAGVPAKLIRINEELIEPELRSSVVGENEV